jgi:hypothetical protein
MDTVAEFIRIVFELQQSDGPRLIQLLLQQQRQQEQGRR